MHFSNPTPLRNLIESLIEVKKKCFFLHLCLCQKSLSSNGLQSGFIKDAGICIGNVNEDNKYRILYCLVIFSLDLAKCVRKGHS